MSQKKRQGYIFIITCLAICLAASGCGGGGGGGCAYNCPDTEYDCYAFSPHGTVQSGTRVYSPDGLYYAVELTPYKYGHIGIYDTATNGLYRQIDFNEGNNDIKGLAWSPSSKLLAVMYHRGEGNYVYTANRENGRIITTSILANYHYMTFRYGYVDRLIFNECVCLPVEIDIEDPFRAGSGACLPWINYGWDLGDHPWGGQHNGFSSNTARLYEDFETLAGYGVKLVRVFLFCDLRTAVVESAGGGLEFDQYVYQDMDALLTAARAYDLKLIPVLLDYTIADGVSIEGVNQVGEWPDRITVDKDDLIELLGEFVAAYADDTTIYAWEIMNEPENVTAVSQADVKTFIQQAVTEVHANADQMVTVGNRYRTGLQEYTGIGLDLYQYHYYDDDPNAPALDYAAADMGLDKPVIIGELQPVSVAEKLDMIENNGYAGALFWSLNADYDFAAVADEFKSYFGY